MEDQMKLTTHRRGFIGMLASGAAALGLTAVASQLQAAVPSSPVLQDDALTGSKSAADLWFNKLKGKHRIVYDAPHPHEIFPFAWPAVFLMTNESTGSPASDCGVVVVLRHSAICYAMTDPMWSKYNFAEVFQAGHVGDAFQAMDAKTATKTRNPFWNTKLGDFKVPGIGAVDIGIKNLQSQGVMFCVCGAAMTVYANALSGGVKAKADEILKDWNDHLIPGIQVVPSGVWALGRAQEHKCGYIFAG